jgi:hypothetical protein
MPLKAVDREWTKGGRKTGEISLRDDPTYAAAADRLFDLEARERELRQRHEAILHGLAEVSPRRDLDRRAEALLTSGDVVESVEERRVRLTEQHQDILDELRVVARAVEMQRRVVDGERGRVGAEIRRRVRPRHRELTRRIYGAIVALSELLDEEEAFRQSLTDADVPLGDIRPVPFAAARLGPGHEYSTAWLWVKDAREAGLLD